MSYWAIFYAGEQLTRKMSEKGAKRKYKDLSKSLLNLDLRLIQKPGGEFSAKEIRRRRLRVMGK